MKHLKNVRYTIGALAAIAAMSLAGQANAQTETIDVNVDVLNEVTLTVDSDLDFGVIVAIGHAVNVAYIAVDPTTGALTAATNNSPAYIAPSDTTDVAEAQITVTDGADGATLNIEIDNVVDPTNAGTDFTLDNFQTSWNGAGAQARTAATPWTQTYLDNAGAGSVLDIGARITTQAGATYGPAATTYAGTFDVIFSY